LRIVARLTEIARRRLEAPLINVTSGLDRHVGPGPDRDPDVRLRERRRVVDPVADHRHHPALGLKPPDLTDLVLG
jgi:hypothetical protein